MARKEMQNATVLGYFKVFLKIFLLTKFIFTELLKKMVETQKFCLGKVDLLKIE